MRIPPNISEIDFVNMNNQREEYLQENARLWRENTELRYKIEQLSARLYLNGLSHEVDGPGLIIEFKHSTL